MGNNTKVSTKKPNSSFLINDHVLIVFVKLPGCDYENWAERNESTFQVVVFIG